MPRPVDASLGTSPGRMVVLGALGALLGLVGGGAAYAVVKLVGLLSNLALLHRVGWSLPDLRHYHPGPSLLAVAAAGGLVVVALARWAPVIRGHGIPESMEAITLRQSRVPPRAVLAKPLSAAVAMGTGGPFGAEGPIIVTGGGIGSLLGQLLPVSPAERRILLATGAAAGMAGVFATPLAAIALAIELLLFERSTRSIVPVGIACAVATAIHHVLLGHHPLFEAAGIHAPSVTQLPIYAVLGLVTGVLAVIIDGGLFAVEEAFRRSPIPSTWHPVVGAVIAAAIGLAVPGSLSVGYWAIIGAVNNRFIVSAALILCVGKLVAWWVALASETSGGTLAPIFLISATLGEALGTIVSHAWPSLHLQPGAIAVVAMGATFAAASRAVLTGTLFALEATGTWQLTVPMLIAVAIAELVITQVLSDRIMTDKLRRRTLRIELDLQADPLRSTLVDQALSPLPAGGVDPSLPTVPAGAPLADAAHLLLSQRVEAVVVDDGDGNGPAGMVTRAAVDGVLVQRAAELERQPPALGPWRSRQPELGPDPDEVDGDAAHDGAGLARRTGTDGPAWPAGER